ncbi:Hypothetical predicted protein, partial [Mytilus galloprovincialis]
MIITFCVITIPFLVLGPSSYEDSVRSVNNSQDSIDCTKEYIHYMDNFTSQESLDEKVIDFLQGTGWMERTILFYGVYYNKTYYSEIEKTEKIYNMSLAYLLAVGCSFIICFILIVKNASKSAKVSLGLESSVAMYTNKVFAAWDYCINNQKNAKVKSVGIKFEITADLKEQKRTIDWDGKEFSDRCAIYFKRVVINLLVIILLGGSLALIAYTAQQMIELQKKEFEEIVILIIQYVPYLTITILNLAVPILFQKLVQFEMYKYETELKLTLARSVLLRLSSPIVLLAILYQQLIVTSKDSTSGKCGNVRWSATGSGLRGDVKCWETYVGQQVYKLVLLDLFVECGILFFGNVPRSIVYRKFKDKSKVIKMVGPQEFDLTQSVVDIVYSQNICWLGMMFSPLIPFMTFLKILIFFYSKKFLLKYCEAQERPYRTSRSNSLFMLVLLLSFVFAAAPIGYMVGRLQPSQSCGPFRLYADANVVMFNTVSYTVASWPGVLRGIFSFLGTVGFFVPVIIALCLLMYYYWLLGQGYKKTEKILQHQLKLEGQDKRYLMDRVSWMWVLPKFIDFQWDFQWDFQRVPMAHIRLNEFILHGSTKGQLTWPLTKKKWERFKMKLEDLKEKFTLWTASIREVEGRYGMAIMTYFKFIRWLFFLNIYLSIIMFAFVIIPGSLMLPSEFEESLTVKGTGWMETKILFYGAYFNKTTFNKFKGESDYKLNYNMGVAYISAVGVCLIISFVKVVRNSAKNMKASYGREGKPAKYSSRVWAGWDFCICKEKHAKSKMASIRTDLIAEMLDTKKKDLWKRRSLTDKLMVYGLRIVINVLITILLGLSLAAIYKVTEQMMQFIPLNSMYQSKLNSLMISFAPYLTITVLNFVVPKVCWRLTLYESYLHETEIKMSITRAILLRLASPMVLLASIYVEIINVDTPPVCGNKRWEDSSSGLTKKIVIKCWENYIGQQLYRLALMDLIVTTFVIFCGNFPRKLIYDRWKSFRIVKFLGEQEFDLPRNVVDLVYSQYLCWLGMFFCPWIPLMTAVKCFILFYLKKVSLCYNLTLVHNCRPEDRPYRTSRSISLFMTVLLWSYMLAVVPLVYVIKS